MLCFHMYCVISFMRMYCYYRYACVAGTSPAGAGNLRYPSSKRVSMGFQPDSWMENQWKILWKWGDLTSSPWLSVLKRSNHLDDLGVHLRKPPFTGHKSGLHDVKVAQTGGSSTVEIMKSVVRVVTSDPNSLVFVSVNEQEKWAPPRLQIIFLAKPLGFHIHPSFTLRFFCVPRVLDTFRNTASPDVVHFSHPQGQGQICG